MNYKSAIAAFVGVLLMSAQLAFGQTSVGPEASFDQEIVLASADTSLNSSETPAGSTFVAKASSVCPKEPHPQAIDPRIIECRAAFAPLPVVPEDFNPSKPEEIAAIRRQGDQLLDMIEASGACGKDSPVGRFEACAIIVYVLAPEHRQVNVPRSESFRGPWTYLVKIYRKQGDTLWTVNSSNSEGRYGPGASNDGEVWNLLAEQHMKEACSERGGQHLGTGVSAGGLLPDTCKPQGAKDIRYIPMLIVFRDQAEEVFSDRKAIQRHFSAPPNVIQAKGGS